MKLETSNYMKKALELAREAYSRGEVPVGAVVVEKNRVIGSGYNKQDILSDPTAHAEIVALREACGKKGNFRLDGADIYVTVKPCRMCSDAISRARISNVYYACRAAGPASHKPKLTKLKGCEAESSKLIRNYFREKRK